MKATILHDVSPDVVKKCSAIAGIDVTLQKPDDADIQIVLAKFVPTEKLKVVQTTSAGVDHLEFSKLPDGVEVFSNAGAFSDPVAEHAFAMILAHEKKICHYFSETRKGIYKRDNYMKERVGTLSGRTLGVLGHGGIGRSCARIAKVFGMSVNAYTRSPKEDPNVDSFLSSAEELVSNCDILLLALPKTKDTLGIVNSELLGKFNGDMIVNMARSDIVVETDLKSFLKENPEKVYLSDVWWKEPKVEFPLPENAFLTPHVGGISRDSADNAILRACRNVKNYLDGHPENRVKIDEYK